VPGEEAAPGSGAKQADESGLRRQKVAEPPQSPADRPKTPLWRYRFTAPLARERVSVPAMLREWHAAMKFGLELASLEIDGQPVDSDTLLLLNAWVSQYSAWNASRQNHFAAWERLGKR
jgi:hypothetical protein